MATENQEGSGIYEEDFKYHNMEQLKAMNRTVSGEIYYCLLAMNRMLRKKYDAYYAAKVAKLTGDAELYKKKDALVIAYAVEIQRCHEGITNLLDESAHAHAKESKDGSDK